MALVSPDGVLLIGFILGVICALGVVCAITPWVGGGSEFAGQP